MAAGTLHRPPRDDTVPALRALVRRAMIMMITTMMSTPIQQSNTTPSATIPANAAVESPKSAKTNEEI